jgi:hypothetical protein
MSRTIPQLAVDELVNVTIRGARVEELDCPGDDTFATLALGSYRVPIALHAPGVTVERVAPAEWPPQLGDIWADRNGSEWFTVKSGRMLDGTGGGWSDPQEVVSGFGPMRLVRRRGWTPAAPAEVGEPEKLDERVAWVAGIREIADLIEARRDVPVPYGNAGQVEFEIRAELERVAGEFGLDITETDTHDRVELKFGPTLLNLCWFKPRAAQVEDDAAEGASYRAKEEAELRAEDEPLPAPKCGRCETRVVVRGNTTGGEPSIRGRFCRTCIDRCHESTDFAHECVVCATPDPLPHRVPDPDAEAVLARALDGEVSA